MPCYGHEGHSKCTRAWAGVSIGKLLELFARASLPWTQRSSPGLIILLMSITVAINLTMKTFVNQTPARRRDIIKLTEALQRRHRSRSRRSLLQLCERVPAARQSSRPTRPLARTQNRGQISMRCIVLAVSTAAEN
jgi:hypothetical protein